MKHPILYIHGEDYDTWSWEYILSGHLEKKLLALSPKLRPHYKETNEALSAPDSNICHVLAYNRDTKLSKC